MHKLQNHTQQNLWLQYFLVAIMYIKLLAQSKHSVNVSNFIINHCTWLNAIQFRHAPIYIGYISTKCNKYFWLGENRQVKSNLTYDLWYLFMFFPHTPGPGTDTFLSITWDVPFQIYFDRYWVFVDCCMFKKSLETNTF